MYNRVKKKGKTRKKKLHKERSILFNLQNKLIEKKNISGQEKYILVKLDVLPQ